jgi:hypothetical protein
MIHWLNHIWNDPLSMKEQTEIGLIVAAIVIITGWIGLYILKVGGKQ